MMQYLRIVPAIAVILLLAVLGTGCGGVTWGAAYHDGYYNDYRYKRSYDGERRGEYIFWDGYWYYHGIGTPYEYYFWDYDYWDDRHYFSANLDEVPDPVAAKDAAGIVFPEQS